jgi:very-short-patch-repair endonuclease
MARSLRPEARLARRLRRRSTDVENLLWLELRKNFATVKFRRQHPIGQRIVDFAVPAEKLVIELDGGQHADRMAEDARRSAELARFGYRVIRFWNNDVTDNLAGVLETVRGEFRAAPPHPASPPPRGGEESVGTAFSDDEQVS